MSCRTHPGDTDLLGSWPKFFGAGGKVLLLRMLLTQPSPCCGDGRELTATHQAQPGFVLWCRQRQGCLPAPFPPWYWGASSPTPLPQPQRVHRHRGAHAHGALFPLELEDDAHTGGMCPQVSPGRGGPGTALCWPSRRPQCLQGGARGPRACAAYLVGPGCRKGTLSAGAGLRNLPRWEEVPLPSGNRRSAAPMLEARREVSGHPGPRGPTLGCWARRLGVGWPRGAWFPSGAAPCLDWGCWEAHQ